MRIGLKILLTLLFVAVVPVGVSGVTALYLARDAVTETAKEKLANEAKHLAELSEYTIMEGVSDLSQSAVLGLHRLGPEELQAALWIIYRENVHRNAVVLLEVGEDKKTKEKVVDVVELVYQEKVAKTAGLVGHQSFVEGDIDPFLQSIPVMEALGAGRAVSLPYADDERGLPLIAFAVSVQGPLRAGGPAQWIIASEFSLGDLNQRFQEARDENMNAFFVALDGKAVCHTIKKKATMRADFSAHPAVKKLSLFGAPLKGALTEPTKKNRFAAWSRVSRLASADGKSWGVIVERDRALVLKRVDELVPRTAFWVGISLLLALLSGFMLSRGVAGPLEILSKVVLRFGKGETDARSKMVGSDEIGTLAQSFNTMADAILARDKELCSFNDDLQGKVDERTKELRDTQDQLLTSQKMAAVGELGAGVAHEINNPLAAALGSAQLALLRADKSDDRIRPHLVDIEKECLRIRDIVQSLLKLSVDTGNQNASSVDVYQVIESALSLSARPLIAQRIQVKREFRKDLPKILGVSADLQQVVMLLINNARDAMPDGGSLVIRSEVIDKKLIRLSFEDTGQGISEQNLEKVFEPFFTTRSKKGHKGMGLAVVHRIVEDHHARIHIDSRLSKGTQVVVTFAAMRDATHLV
ncbi:MAG: HAMP domain-containing protein [Deltaproteobacteria bacterium]|nr:HAMP domain-containing protein [Deltaproteobacteria bacterium]